MCRYDTDHSNFIDLMELKLMMEKLGEPQTHIGLKAMIKEVDEDNDGQISFREVSSPTVEAPVTCTYASPCSEKYVSLLSRQYEMSLFIVRVVSTSHQICYPLIM